MKNLGDMMKQVQAMQARMAEMLSAALHEVEAPPEQFTRLGL